MTTPARADPAGAAAEGWRAFTGAYPRMLLAWAPVVATHALAGALLAAYASATGFPLDDLGASTGGLDMGETMRFLGVGVPLFFVASAATLVGWGLVARVVERQLGGTPTPRGDVFRAPWPALAALSAALVLIYSAGVMLALVGFLVFLHWFLYAPAALADRRAGVGDALEESRRFARERRAYGFTALVALAWVAVVVVGTALGGAIETGLRALGADASLAEALASPLGAWPLAPLVPALPAAFWWLARREESMRDASAPMAHAPPPEGPHGGDRTEGNGEERRTRSTKCPQCGALVAYKPTGKPVDVTCPVCGRAGRVL